MRHRILTPISALVPVGMMLAAVAACGATSQSSSSGNKLKPKPGHVIMNPTAAQAFIHLPMTVEREANGDLLILDAGNWDRSGAKIVEMNPHGKPVWEYVGGMDFPHSAYPVGSNDILISDTNNNRVFMITRKGKTIWTTDSLGGGGGKLGQGRFSDHGRLLYPNDAVMMPNNQILISSRFNNTVWEIKKNGQVTWKCARFMFRQHRARLIRGQLWVADSDNGRVIIINHACTKIVFSYGGTNASGTPNVIWPRSFNPYPGGKYIISDSYDSRILELNSHKKVVRTWGQLYSPYYVEVTKNGDLLTGDENTAGALLLSPNGGIAQQYRTIDPTHYPTSVVNPGFEKGSTGWLKGDMLTETLAPGQLPNMGIDRTVAHTGKASAYISWPQNKPHLYLFWQQIIAVKPGRTYHFSGWIKTKNVLACKGCDHGKYTQPFGAAEYYVTYLKPGDPYNPSPAGFDPGQQYSYGTMPWSEESQTFKVPSGVTRVQIQGILYGRGKVWFDGVSLK